MRDATATTQRTIPAAPDSGEAVQRHERAASASIESDRDMVGRDPGVGYHLSKRAIDIAGALVGLAVTALVFVPLVILIRIDSPGSVIFRQTRVTKSNRRFPFYKFRTMAVARQPSQQGSAGRRKANDLTPKRPDDPRVTRAGSFLRRFSLDEMPQFWCVLKGDMSLVGPRPPLPREVACYGPRELARLRVKQGMTGLWQVTGRSRLPFDAMIELDREYVRNRSLALDVWILLRTLPVVLRGDGAF